MTDTPTIAMVLIARDEADNIAPCLDTFWGHVDEVVLCDTGSKDGTVERAREYAAKRSLEGAGTKLIVGHFDWCDDFAAARNHADSLTRATFRCWADLDDRLIGAENLRQIAAAVPEHVAGLVATYDYAHDEHGNVICRLKRERLVRDGFGGWDGRVHEAQAVRGPMQELEPGLVRWVHAKALDGKASNARNLRILRAWAKDEPQNSRVLAYMGTEELVRGKPKRALTHFRRYLKLKTGWDEERAQVHRKLAVALGMLGRHPEAIDTALEAVKLLPAWPDSYLTLAEAYHALGEYAKAAEWAREVLRRGAPETLLITNPTDYSVQPRLMLASSLGGLGEIDEAIEVAEQALSIVPDHPLLAPAYRGWLGQQKREATAQTVVAMAEQLIAHDEQLKAKAVLEAAPYFAQDHPAVVAARSEIRERLAPLLGEGYATHYTDASAPEDFIADEDVDRVAGSLPRARFLLSGLCERLGVGVA